MEKTQSSFSKLFPAKDFQQQEYSLGVRLSNEMLNDLKQGEPLHNFTSGAVRSADGDDVRLDLVCPSAMLRLAAIYKEGADKYGETNYCRGIPISNLLNHLQRHYNLWRKGDKTEDHLAKIAWGVFSIMHYEDKCTHHYKGIENRELDDQYLGAQQFDFLQGDPKK